MPPVHTSTATALGGVLTVAGAGLASVFSVIEDDTNETIVMATTIAAAAVVAVAFLVLVFRDRDPSVTRAREALVGAAIEHTLTRAFPVTDAPPTDVGDAHAAPEAHR